jgi:hypothetical protein
MVQPQEHGDPDFFVVLVDLDVVEAVHDAVDELDSQRLIVDRDVDPVPSNQAWVSARRVRDGRVAAERPMIPKADEHPQVDDLSRDAEHPRRLLDDPVEGHLVGTIQERDEALVGRDQPGIDQPSTFRMAKSPTKGFAPALQRGKTVGRGGTQERLWP